MKHLLLLLISIVYTLSSFAQITSSTIPETSIYYHAKKESFLSRTVKKAFVKAEQTAFLGNSISDLSTLNNENAEIPKSVTKKVIIEEETFENKTLWTFKPKDGTSDKVIFYTHGGGYIMGILDMQWKLISEIVQETNATVVIANYPCAYQNTAKDTYAYLEKLYKKVLKEHSEKTMFFYGDSAGGGLAIAFAQYLNTVDLPQPSQIITLSPWLDVSLSNPDILRVESNDLALEKSALQKVGQLYAGDIDVKDPRISPINGDFKDIAKVTVFIGGAEIFISDAQKLKHQLETENIPFNYYEYPHMIHTWMLVPIFKESKIAFRQMMDIINKG